ncbi:EVE domain-containing protein [soil metagenome]
MKYWLVKSEPAAYSWDDLVKDGKTAWTGVRNYQARINLREMKIGDRVLFYHSVVGKEVVGQAEVYGESYPDPTAKEEGWICVDLKPLKELPKAVTLEAIKGEKSLTEIKLLRQSRLSVMPLTSAEYKTIIALAGR